MELVKNGIIELAFSFHLQNFIYSNTVYTFRYKKLRLSVILNKTLVFDVDHEF